MRVPSWIAAAAVLAACGCGESQRPAESARPNLPATPKRRPAQPVVATVEIVVPNMV
jgi:hypothetical protein